MSKSFKTLLLAVMFTIGIADASKLAAKTFPKDLSESTCPGTENLATGASDFSKANQEVTGNGKPSLFLVSGLIPQNMPVAGAKMNLDLKLQINKFLRLRVLPATFFNAPARPFKGENATVFMDYRMPANHFSDRFSF